MGMIPYRGSQTSPGVVRELKSSEDVMFAPEVARQTDFIRRLMKRFRMLSKKYYVEARIVQILGENKRMEAETYLAGEDNNDYDYDFKAGAGFAKSDESTVDQIMKLGEGNPSFLEKIGVDPRVVGEEVLRKVGLTKLREDTFKDERQAKWNLQDVLNGVKPIISKYINPDAHIKVFTDFTKTDTYRPLDVGIKFAIDWYIDQCNAIKLGMMQPQLPPQMLPGMPPPGQQPIGATPMDMEEAQLNRSMANGQPTNGVEQPITNG